MTTEQTQATLVIGGCRSGKSSHALMRADQVPGTRKLFIATSVPTDQEMHERVARHRHERGRHWETAEVPVDIHETIDRMSGAVDAILVDCLTLWVSNLMAEGCDQEAVFDRTRQLIKSLESASCPVFLVSNEVGAGIVPENRLARQFRDLAGFVNQQVAGAAGEVVWMVAGIPVTIKPLSRI